MGKFDGREKMLGCNKSPARPSLKLPRLLFRMVLLASVCSWANQGYLAAAENVCPLLVKVDSDLVYVPKNGAPRKLFEIDYSTPSIAVDYIKRVVYWGSVGHFWSTTLDGATTAHILEKNSHAIWQVTGLGIDPQGKTIYFTFPYNKIIYKMALDGSDLTILFQPTDTADAPSALAVDPMRGFLWYTIEHKLSNSKYTYSIHKCNVDGSDDTVIIPDQQANNIVADTHTSQICWATGVIYCADYDGNNKREVYASGGNIYHLAIEQSTLFFTGFGTGNAHSINVDGTDLREIEMGAYKSSKGAIAVLGWGCQSSDKADDCDPLIQGSDVLNLERDTALVFEVKTCSRVKVQLSTFLVPQVYNLVFGQSSIESNDVSIVPTGQTIKQMSQFSQDCATTRQFWVSWKDDVVSGGIGLSPGTKELMRMEDGRESGDKSISEAKITTEPADVNAKFKIFRMSSLSVLDPPANLEHSVHLHDGNNDTCLSLESTDMYTFSSLSRRWIPESLDSCWLPGLAIKLCVPAKLNASFTVTITGRGLVCADTHFEVMGQQTKEPACGVAGEYMGCELSEAADSGTGGLVTCLAECRCEKGGCKQATIQIPDKYDDWKICEINVT